MGLDWNLPAYPPAPEEGSKPLRVRVLAAEPPPPSDELDARAHVERGSLFVRLRLYPAAAADFNRAAALDPKRSPWEEAVRAYSEVLGRHARDAEALHQRAHAQVCLGHWEEAVGDLSRAVGMASQRRDLLVCRGKMHLRRGQKDQAAADLLGATDGRPEEANRLARELATSPDLARREPAVAVELAEQAVRMAPGKAEYHGTLGVARYRAGQWEAAIRALQEAERLAPGEDSGFNALFLALCHHHLGNPAAAREQHDRATRWYLANEAKLTAARRQEWKALREEAGGLLHAPAHQGRDDQPGSQH
jgi:tetratricopeptide (TPR) repeat protein